MKAKGIEDPVSYYQEEVKKLNSSLVDNQTKQIGDSSPCKYVGHFLVKAMFDHLDLENSNSSKMNALLILYLSL